MKTARIVFADGETASILAHTAHEAFAHASGEAARRGTFVRSFVCVDPLSAPHRRNGSALRKEAAV